MLILLQFGTLRTPLDLSRQLNSIRQKAWQLIPNEDIQEDMINLEIDSLDALFDVDVQDFFLYLMMIKRKWIKQILQR